MESYIKIYSKLDLERYAQPREGDNKIISNIHVLPNDDPEKLDISLGLAHQAKVHYAILGIPEGFGAPANEGRTGQQDAWPAYLSSFLNLQATGVLAKNDVVVVGHVTVSDLQKRADQLIEKETKKHLRELRDLVQQLDLRVYQAVKKIASQRLVPIVIGGGHNNAYPIIRGVAEALQELRQMKKPQISVINCDAHAGWRRIQDGRHSGNPFSYAWLDQLLKSYFVVGLDKYNNSTEMIEGMRKQGVGFNFYDDLMRNKQDLETATLSALAALGDTALGVEVDLDSIVGTPASASRISGPDFDDVRYKFLHTVASSKPTLYLHLSEGAPRWDQNGNVIVGKSLALLTAEFLHARCDFLRQEERH